MLTSKFIAYFLDEVSTWQKKLSTADMVITIWMEVQRTWSHLESIFIGSEDIRKQLPGDSDRFDKIDADFKVINGFCNVFFVSVVRDFADILNPNLVVWLRELMLMTDIIMRT